MNADAPLTIQEAVQLGAVNSAFFCRTFFPKTCRQPFGVMHNDVWRLLDNPANRMVNLLMFRGSAKTSVARMFTAKRISYGLAHTIMYLGKSEGHAARSIRWLRRQVMYNTQWAETFQLRPGGKWQDTEAELIHGVDEYPIWIMASGITGSVRGVNQDDFRPDFICLDDVLDDENSATPEQREKISNLVYGAVKESLAPPIDAPDAKLVALNTPQDREDFAVQALDDPEWVSARFGCWTKDTEGLPVEHQESSWPERYKSEDLRKQKKAAIFRNKLSTFVREKECLLSTPEESSFLPEWLNYFDLTPQHMSIVLAIDPVPPPSEAQLQKGLKGKDYEALAVVGRLGKDYYLLDYSMKRGHTPEWTIAEFFRLALKWRPKRVLVESVAYQRTLAWLLRKAMEHQRQFFVIHEMDDKRKKYDVIVDSLSGIAANGHLWVRQESQEDFIQQFSTYPNVSNDDILEAVARAVMELSGAAYSAAQSSMMESLVLEEEEDIPELDYAQYGAP